MAAQSFLPLHSPGVWIPWLTSQAEPLHWLSPPLRTRHKSWRSPVHHVVTDADHVSTLRAGGHCPLIRITTAASLGVPAFLSFFLTAARVMHPKYNLMMPLPLKCFFLPLNYLFLFLPLLSGVVSPTSDHLLPSPNMVHLHKAEIRLVSLMHWPSRAPGPSHMLVSLSRTDFFSS